MKANVFQRLVGTKVERRKKKKKRNETKMVEMEIF